VSANANASASAKVVPWTADDLVRRLDDVLAVYASAMNYSAELVEARRGFITAHARRDGFRAMAALDEDGTLLGFTYGYLSHSGQWWHDQVRTALKRGERRYWLTDCYELVELHVHPDRQGHGLGAILLRALLDGAPGATVLLSTPEVAGQASRAWRLYRRFGFVDVVRHLRFPGDDRFFAILGRTLPL
jgi:GNAT superfamily N-acetyltransferase